MCGRYHIDMEADIFESRKYLDELNRRYTGKPELAQMKTGEIFPTNIVPIISNNRKMQQGCFLMKWGFSALEGTGVVINARSESLLEKPMFRKAAIERRCLVPATNYYEWEHSGKQKTKYAIRLKSDGLIYMAGIYRFEESEIVPTFVIITRPAAKEITHIHDRMPLMLAGGDKEDWLNPLADAEDVMEHSQEQVRFDAVV